MINGLEDKLPKGVEMKLEKDRRYSFCTCGQSKQIPLCDNSHRRVNEENKTSYKPFKICPREDCKVDVYCSNWPANNK